MGAVVACLVLAFLGFAHDFLFARAPAAPAAAPPPAKRAGRFAALMTVAAPAAATAAGEGHGWGLVWRSKVLLGGTVLHVLDLGSDALALLSFVAHVQWGYAGCSIGFLALSVLAAYVYTSIEHAPLLRPEVGDTVKMAKSCGALKGKVGKVVALDIDTRKAEAEERAERDAHAEAEKGAAHALV